MTKRQKTTKAMCLKLELQGVDEECLAVLRQVLGGAACEHDRFRCPHNASSQRIVCTASEERSQIRNRELALLRLHEKMNLIAERQHTDQDKAMWIDHYQRERGKAVRIFKGLPPKEATD